MVCIDRIITIESYWLVLTVRQKTHGLVNPERKAARKEYSFFLPGGILHRVPVEQIHTKKFSEACDWIGR